MGYSLDTPVQTVLNQLNRSVQFFKASPANRFILRDSFEWVDSSVAIILSEQCESFILNDSFKWVQRLVYFENDWIHSL